MSKVALVTGGNRGIGYCIAKQLSQQFDGTVILTARDDKQGHEACAQLSKDGQRVKFHKLDVTCRESIKSLSSHVLENYGGLDILVNNAGIMIQAAAQQSYAEKADQCVKTNFFGTLDVYDSFYPLLRKHARIVNVSSSMGHLKILQPSLALKFISPKLTVDQCVTLMQEYVRNVKSGKAKENGWPVEGTHKRNPAYSVSKLGVTALTAVLARKLQENGRQDVLVNAVCPGWCQTAMGGPSATKSADEGARSPVYLSLLEPGVTSPNGQLVIDNEVIPWKQGNVL